MIEYPEAYALQVASRLESADEVERYRGDGGWENARLGIPDEVFRRRGSIRDFSPEPIARDVLRRSSPARWGRSRWTSLRQTSSG
jgi:hypothetical protein